MTEERAPTVLVVEDDDSIREALHDVLQASGLRAATAPDGRQALDRLQGNGLCPDLILLDLMMPDVDGWAFRRAQLADPRLAEIPVILLTAVHDAAQQADALGLPVLQKPVDVHELLDSIHRAVG